MILKTLAMTSALLIMVGCTTTDQVRVTPPPTPENEALVCKIPFDVPTIEPVEWSEFDWTVLNEEKVRNDLEEGNEIYYIGLTYEGYTALSNTMQEILRYSRQQRELIRELDNYYSK